LAITIGLDPLRNVPTPATVTGLGAQTATLGLRSRDRGAFAQCWSRPRLGRLAEHPVRWHHELVADLPDRADHRLVLGTQLGPQPPYVHVHGSGAAEVVVTPHLAQQLIAGEDP